MEDPWNVEKSYTIFFPSTERPAKGLMSIISGMFGGSQFLHA
jgi:hypothetical protein